MTEQDYREYLEKRTFDVPTGWMADLVASPDWRHRWFAARMRCGLNRLASDSSADVRMEVAWQKYRLDELSNDPDPRVSWAANQCKSMSWEDVYDRYTTYEMDYEGLLELLNNLHIEGLVSPDERNRAFKRLFDEGWSLEGGNMRIWVEKTCCPELVCATLEREKCNLERTLILASNNINGSEIKDMVAKQFSVEQGKITCGTPESLGAFLLRKYAGKVGLNPLFSIAERSANDDEICREDLLDSAFAMLLDHRDVMDDANSLFDWIIDEEGNAYWSGGVRICDMLYYYKITDETNRRWLIKSNCWMAQWRDRIDEIYHSGDESEQERLERDILAYRNPRKAANAFQNRWWIAGALDAIMAWEPELADAPKSQQFEIVKYAVEQMRKNELDNMFDIEL